MSDLRLENCHQCGSKAIALDWGSVTEYYGVSDQLVDISCSGELRTHCPVQVSINVDSDYCKDSSRVESILIKAWNDLNEPLKTK